MSLEGYQKINDFLYKLEVQFKQGMPRGKVCKELLLKSPFEDLNISLEIEKIISSLMLKRNHIGKYWEKSGEDYLAINAYEKNVSDLFEGSFPYERLKILYSKYGFYEKAINVCEKYLSLPNHPLGYDVKKRSRFVEYLTELKKKKQTSDNNKKNTFFVMKNSKNIPIEEFNLRGKKISKSAGKAKYEINNTKNGTIEEFVLSCQTKEGSSGLWTENQYWWFIMSLLFWDIIFLPIPGMFYIHKDSPWQDMPLDLFGIDFYIRRSDEINTRLNEIGNSEDSGRKKVIDILKKYYTDYKGIPCRPIEDWDNYSLENLIFSLEGLSPKQLVSIMKRLLLFFNDFRKGLPDLFLIKNNEPFFIECKEKDEVISDWQKSWHQYLMTQTKIQVKIYRVEDSEQLINNF